MTGTLAREVLTTHGRATVIIDARGVYRSELTRREVTARGPRLPGTGEADVAFQPPASSEVRAAERYLRHLDRTKKAAADSRDVRRWAEAWYRGSGLDRGVSHGALIQAAANLEIPLGLNDAGPGCQLAVSRRSARRIAREVTTARTGRHSRPLRESTTRPWKGPSAVPMGTTHEPS